MATVVCCRWLDAFPASYVRILRNAVRANLARPHRFICVTDDPAALPDVETRLLPDMGIPERHQRSGGWPKISLFKPGLLPPDEPTLFLDLDILVRGSLDPFLERVVRLRGIHGLREWNPVPWSVVPAALRPDRGIQSSVLGFYPGEQAAIYHRFMADRDAAYALVENEQQFITVCSPHRRYFPLDWTASFKWHCVSYYPLNLLRPKPREPRAASVVVFHGNPRPIQLVPLGDYRWGTRRKFGHGPVDWVRDYWLRHDESWVEPPARAA